MKRSIITCGFLCFVVFTGTTSAATVSTLLKTDLDTAISNGSFSLGGFDVDVSSSGGGVDFNLTTDSDQTSDNDVLNTLLNGSAADITFGRFRFANTDGTGTLILTQTATNQDPNVRLLAGLVDVDFVQTVSPPTSDHQTIMAGGSPVLDYRILGAWEYKNSDNGNNNYVYSNINYDSETGIMSPPLPNPETNPEPIILVDITDLPSFSVTPEEAGNQVAIFVVDGLAPPPTTALLVNTTTGAVALQNQTNGDLSIDYYRIDGDTNSLDPVGWNSLDDQNLDSLGPDPGQSWAESGGSNTELLSEAFLDGNSMFSDEEVVGLGHAFNEVADLQTLRFHYGNSSEGTLTEGPVAYVVAGDLNNDGVLSDLDVAPFILALTNRTLYEATYPKVVTDFVGDFDGNGRLDLGDVNGFSTAVQSLGPAETNAVPEPASFALLLLATALGGIVFGPRKLRLISRRGATLGLTAALASFGFTASSQAITMTSFNSSSLVGGFQSLGNFDVNVTSDSNGSHQLVVDNNTSSDNGDLNGIYNGGNNIPFGRLRFSPNDGNGTVTFNVTDSGAAPFQRLFLGLVDVDNLDTQTLMSSGSPVSSDLIVGAWEYDTNGGNDNDYVYPNINYDSGTGVMSPPSPNPSTDPSNPESLILVDITSLSNVSINPNSNSSQIALFLVEDFPPAAAVIIDRGSGDVRIQNDSTAPYNIIGYSLTSGDGAFDQTGWNTISGNIDGDGNGSFDDGSWTVLTDPGSHGDLSEATFEGNGGQLDTGESNELDLGEVWIQNLMEDVQFEVLLTDGTILTGDATFTGGDGAPYDRSDLDFDNDIDRDDWLIYVSGLDKDLSGLTPAQAYQMGDLNYDGVNSFVDFGLFKSDFEAANGAGSFARMLSSVPEPSTLALLAAIPFGTVFFQRRRKSLHKSIR